MKPHRGVFLGSALALTLLVGCGQSDDSGLIDVDMRVNSSEAPTGDQPSNSDGAAAVVPPASGWTLWLTVRRIDVRVSDEFAGYEDDTGTWYTVFNGVRRIDLFAGTGISVPFGAVSVAPGRVTQLRLVLAEDPELVTPAFATAVRCPSCQQSGLKLKPDNDLVVASGAHVRASILIDGKRSLFETPKGYVLHPVIDVLVHDAGNPP